MFGAYAYNGLGVYTEGGNTFDISNTGDGDLTVSSISADNNFILSTGFPPSLPLTILGGESEEVTVNIDWDLVGDSQQEGTITISSDDPDEPSVTVTVTAIPASQTMPTVQITSPNDGATVTSSSLTTSGTANDADGSIDLVQVLLNNGSWQNASGTTSWTTNLTLQEGSNTINAKSKDNDGNWSSEDQITVTYTPVDLTLSLPTDASACNGATISIPISLSNPN